MRNAEVVGRPTSPAPRGDSWKKTSAQRSGCSTNRWLLGVLGDAVAEGPVLLRDLRQHDHNVLGAHPDRGDQPLDERRVELFLRLDGAAGVEGDVDDECAGGAFDPRVSTSR